MDDVVQYRRRTKAMTPLARYLQIAAVRYTSELGTREAMRIFASMVAKQDAPTTTE